MALQNMRYSRLLEEYEGFERAPIARAIGRALGLRSHERIIMNFARYRAGDFLDSHTDHPSGNSAYERQRAFVWHLSAASWDESHGGMFVDEGASRGGTAKKFAPRYNSLVHFDVPRWHRVEKVATKVRDARYSVYGWVISARLRPLRTLEELEELRSECGGTAVVGWFGEALSKSPAYEFTQCFAEACIGRVGLFRLRGEETLFALSTSVEVAQALGFASAAGTNSGNAFVAVIHWGSDTAGDRADVINLTHSVNAAALGVFLDKHIGPRQSKGSAGDSKISDAQVESMIEGVVDDLLARRNL
jgi:hypothetical protein